MRYFAVHCPECSGTSHISNILLDAADSVRCKHCGEMIDKAVGPEEEKRIRAQLARPALTPERLNQIRHWLNGTDRPECYTNIGNKVDDASEWEQATSDLLAELDRLKSLSSLDD